MERQARVRTVLSALSPAHAALLVEQQMSLLEAPAVKLIGTFIPPIPANDLEQARWRVHYDPRLPHSGVLASAPRISTTFGFAAGTVLHVADLRTALRLSGVNDESVPSQWDGAQLALHTGAEVIAEWPEIVFAQSRRSR